jgi:hypothetical protein
LGFLETKRPYIPNPKMNRMSRQMYMRKILAYFGFSQTRLEILFCVFVVSCKVAKLMANPINVSALL